MPRSRSRGCQWSVRVYPMVATATRHPPTACYRCWSRRPCERPSGQRLLCTSAGDLSLACDRRTGLAQFLRTTIVSTTGMTALKAVKTNGLPPAIPFRMSSGSPGILDRTDRLERRWRTVCGAYRASHFVIGWWIIEVECIEKTYSLSFEYSLRLYFVYLFCISCASLHAITWECACPISIGSWETISDYLEYIERDIIDHGDESTNGNF